LSPSVSPATGTAPLVAGTTPALPRPLLVPPSPPPNPASRVPRNDSANAVKRRVQLMQKAGEATPRSYRPAKLYLHRLSPLTMPPVTLQTAAQTPHPPTPPGGAQSRSLTSIDASESNSDAMSTSSDSDGHASTQEMSSPVLRADAVTATSSSPAMSLPVTVILVHKDDKSPCEHDMYCPRGRKPY
jgi:hypothetical protein